MPDLYTPTSKIYYEVHGTGAPLFLIPGLLGTIESTWRRFIPSFARHYQVITMDLRGHGRSANMSEDLTLDSMMDDLTAVYHRLEIQSAMICGYSLGAYLGLMCALDNPPVVSSLLMHATKSYWTTEAAKAQAGNLHPEGIRAKVPQWAEQLKREHADWEKLVHSCRHFVEQMPSQGLQEKGLHGITVPVLVSLGENDEMIPGEEGRRLAASLSPGRFHSFPGAKHPMASVDKEAFLSIARSFFDNH